MKEKDKKEIYNILLNKQINNPFKKIYNLLYYAELDMIGDDSTWMCQDNYNPLKLLLSSEKIGKLIWVEFYHDEYKIMTKDLDCKPSFYKSFRDEFPCKYYKEQEEMLKDLIALLEPCLIKKDFDLDVDREFLCIYPSTFRALS